MRVTRDLRRRLWRAELCLPRLALRPHAGAGWILDQARRLSHSGETEPRRRAPLHPQGLRSRRPLPTSHYGDRSLAGALVPY